MASQLYEVTFPDGARISESPRFPIEVACLKVGTVVHVVELKGDKARITKPVRGWCSKAHIKPQNTTAAAGAADKRAQQVPKINEGDRCVLIDGRVGTIRYAGTTTFAKGNWYGVALDKPEGKHNGMVKGKRYFDCPPQHGVFVRMNKIAKVKSAKKASQSKSGTATTVFVRTPEGARLGIRCGATDDVTQLKYKIQTQLGIAPAQMILNYENSPLAESLSLSGRGLFNPSATVVLTLRDAGNSSATPGKWKIHISNEFGADPMTLTVTPNDPVKQVKQHIHVINSSYAVNKIQLYSKGKLLSDSQSLKRAGLVNGGYLEFALGTTPATAAPSTSGAATRSAGGIAAKAAASTANSKKISSSDNPNRARWYGCWFFEGEESYVDLSLNVGPKRLSGEAVDEDNDNLVVNGTVKQDDQGHPKWTFKMTMKGEPTIINVGVLINGRIKGVWKVLDSWGKFEMCPAKNLEKAPGRAKATAVKAKAKTNLKSAKVGSKDKKGKDNRIV